MRQSRLRFLAATSLVAAAACSRASSSKDVREASSVVALRGSADSGYIVNRRWLTTTVAYRELPDWTILTLETDSMRWCDGEIGWCHVLTVDGWLNSVRPATSPSWTFRSVGTDASYAGRFYRVRHKGCCDETDAYEYFSLRTGSRAFRTTLPLARLSVPNTDIERYAGFIDTWSALGPQEAEADSAVAGVLQYGPPDSVQSLILFVPRSHSRVHFRVNQLELRAEPRQPGKGEFDLWLKDSHPSSARISGVWIWLRLLPDYDAPYVEVAVPVTGDRLDLGRAVLPPSLALR